MFQYAETEGILKAALQIAMPRSPRIYAPGGTVHVVARCNNRDFYFHSDGDFEILLDHLHGMSRDLGSPSLPHVDVRKSRSGRKV